MFKKMKHMKNEKGLTLIELLAVIVILAIIAAIAIPSIGSIINNQRDKAILADASTILLGAKLAVADGACETTCTNTELADYVEGITGKYIATKSGTTWSIGYEGLAETKFKSKRYKDLLFSTSGTKKITTAAEGSLPTITEADLNAAMGK